MKHGLVMVLALGGCGGIDLSFESDATSIVVTAEEGRATRISICPASTGLLTCDDTMTFTVEIAGERKVATPALFGGFQAHFAIDATGIPVNVTRDIDGATATVVVPPAFAVTGPTTTVS